MNRVRIIAVVIAAVLAISGIAIGQKRSRPKPKPSPPTPASSTSSRAKIPVNIRLKQGDSVSGYFLRADAETVQIEIPSGRLTIKMREVASLIFTDEEAGSLERAEEAQKTSSLAAADQIPQAARKAYSSLRKLADAAKIGLPYLQYGNLLIEARSVVEEALAELPEGTLRNDLARAMEAYTDAGQAWGTLPAYGILAFGTLPIATEPGATLMRKYDIKPSPNAVGQADHLRLQTTLNTIWAVAGSYLNNVAILLKQ